MDRSFPQWACTLLHCAGGQLESVVHGRRIREGRWDVVLCVLVFLCSGVLVFLCSSMVRFTFPERVHRERTPTERPMLGGSGPNARLASWVDRV